MATIAQIYTSALYRNFKPLYANWDPDQPIQLGSFGLLRGRTYTPLGQFDNAALLKEVTNPNPSQKTFASRGGTQVTFHAAGSAPAGGIALANAAVEIGFSSEDAVFFNAADCKFSSVADKVKLGKEIMKRYRDKSWEREWVIVTDLIRAGSTTIVVSGSTNASILLEATGGVQQINLADASLKLSVRNSRNVGYQTVSKEGVVPLIGLCKVQWKFFRPKDFGPLGIAPTDPAIGRDGPAIDSDADAIDFGQLQ